MSSSSSEAVNMRGSERGGKRKKKSLPDSIKRLHDKLHIIMRVPHSRKRKRRKGTKLLARRKRKRKLTKMTRIYRVSRH